MYIHFLRIHKIFYTFFIQIISYQEVKNLVFATTAT